MDVFGKALHDFHYSQSPGKLWLHNSYGKPEDMPVEVFFRTGAELTELEMNALEACRGKILDVGAGAGTHSLLLQNLGFNITALEISGAACSIMSSRGIRKVVNTNIWNYSGSQYDTLLMLMNGLGLAGDIHRLTPMLRHLKSLLNPGGQILCDSSDIAYLYEGIDLQEENYYGEISYQYEYKSHRGPWFKWLYIHLEFLTELAAEAGFNTELISRDEMDQYLVRLTPG